MAVSSKDGSWPARPVLEVILERRGWTTSRVDKPQPAQGVSGFKSVGEPILRRHFCCDNGHIMGCSPQKQQVVTTGMSRTGASIVLSDNIDFDETCEKPLRYGSNITPGEI